jgi:hypothetical protein
MKCSQSTMVMTAANSMSTFLEKHVLKRSNLKVYKIDDSQFWLETSDGFISVRLIVRYETREILYDVFSPKYDVCLKEATIDDVEKLEAIAEATGKWRYEKSIEDLWFLLDWIKLWARENGFDIRRTHLI